LNKIKTIPIEVMSDVDLKTVPRIQNENSPTTSNDPEVVFNLFINRLIGPNKKTSYGEQILYVYVKSNRNCYSRICRQKD
jgi:hypothetical protein